jgi:hypothetical protein
MASFDTLAFADFDVVTGPPIVDGFITADAGVNTNEAESGYVNGSRYSYANGTLPPVVISLPLKLMLFVIVDGWHLIISSLVKTYKV